MSSTDGSSQELHGTTLTVDQSVSLTIAADSLLILGMDLTPHSVCGHMLTHADDRPPRKDRRCCGLIQPSKLVLAPLAITASSRALLWMEVV